MTKCMQCYCMAVSLSVSADKPQKTVTKSVVLSFPGNMAPLKNNTNSAYLLPKVVSIWRSQHIQVVKLIK
jgi:hypothetical protein